MSDDVGGDPSVEELCSPCELSLLHTSVIGLTILNENNTFITSYYQTIQKDLSLTYIILLKVGF